MKPKRPIPWPAIPTLCFLAGFIFGGCIVLAGLWP